MQTAISALGKNYPDLVEILGSVQEAFGILHEVFATGGKLLIAGNGGSAADADHIVGELAKGFMLRRPVPAAKAGRWRRQLGKEAEYLIAHLQEGLPAIALAAHTSLSTAFANDVAPDLVFAQQVHVYGRNGDAFLAISTSGKSSNILQALRVAKASGLRTIGLTGRSGGYMGQLCDVVIKAPYDDAPRVQERHLPIYHALCMGLEAAFFGADAEEQSGSADFQYIDL